MDIEVPDHLPRSVETVGAIRSARHRIRHTCLKCNHSEPTDISRFVDAYRLINATVDCPVCGQPAIHYFWNGGEWVPLITRTMVRRILDSCGKPPVCKTLQDHKDEGMHLRIYCDRCNRGDLIPWDKLIEKYGEDYELVANRSYILRHMKCTKCDKPATSLQVLPY